MQNSGVDVCLKSDINGSRQTGRQREYMELGDNNIHNIFIIWIIELIICPVSLLNTVISILFSSATFSWNSGKCPSVSQCRGAWLTSSKANEDLPSSI